MIILKILLYILLAVLGIILLVLITPAGGEFSYIDGKFSYKVKLWIINIMDSEGGGLYSWWKKRRSKKKEKPEKPKKPKPAKEKKAKKKKEREKYEWEKELDDIPVNDPEEDMLPAEPAAENAESVTAEAQTSVKEEDEPDKKSKKKKDEESDDDFFDDDEEEQFENEDKKSLGDKVEFIVGIWESAQRPLLKIFKGFKLKDLYIDFVIADDDAYDCALKYGRYSVLIYNGIAFFSQLFTVRLKTIDVRPQFGVSRGRWDAAGKLSFRLGTVVIAGAWFLLTYLFRTFIPEKLRKRKLKKSAARQK
ncbi:hypothetical protein [Ruminococcus flavefaciens]|uniref:DUF2953 domain-containing protein n=1 Tax=Ruminococcus flavefaciens 007c TaxID=1341157 RepID=W7USC6_RUMFL|nr:hypothetical protein [Ruminococcus flavefaciens]EWM54299.1 hypothetical protein RF007C_11865 [Ruminococcus flavefaciens 007c]